MAAHLGVAVVARGRARREAAPLDLKYTLSCSDYVQEVMERLAQLADLERRARAVEVAAAEVRLAEGQVDEDPAFPEYPVWRR